MVLCWRPSKYLMDMLYWKRAPFQESSLLLWLHETSQSWDTCFHFFLSNQKIEFWRAFTFTPLFLLKHSNHLLCQLIDSRFLSNEDLRLNSRDLTAVNFLAIGFLITFLLSTCTANTPTIHLVVDGIDDHRRNATKWTLKVSCWGNTQSAGAPQLRLELCTPSIARKGASHIAYLLKNCSAISELVLSDGYIHSDDILLHIAEALQTNLSLTKLSLPNMMLLHTEQNGSALNKVLQVNKSLTHLDLSWNETMSDSRARCIFEGLQHNTTLVNLNLCRNGITASDPDTARSLTKMLQVNKSLIHLNLSRNKFSDSGARCIFDGLQHNNTLVYLSLSSAGIQITNSDTAMSLTKMLQVNKSLTHLGLSNCLHIHTVSHWIIFEGLEHNTTLRYLNIRGISDIKKLMQSISLGHWNQIIHCKYSI